MARKSLQFGQQALRRILKQLEKPQSLEHDYATAILEQAKRNASSRPTPQAPMAAAIMAVEGSNIVQRGSAGQPAVDVAIGSEFGSTLYPQFHRPPNQTGYWLYPATRDSAVLGKADKSLEEILKQAAAGMGF